MLATFPDVRSLIVGIVLGTLLATINVYVGLKVGWWDSGGILAVLAAFWLLKRTRSNRPEHSVLAQTTASAAAATPAAIGLLGAIPAMSSLGSAVPWGWALPWAFALSLAGLGLAVALRASVLEHEVLPFPSGAAIAKVTTALHHQGMGTQERAALGAAALAGALTWFRDGRPRWIPGEALGLALSPLFIGFGLLLDLRSGLGMILGACVAWGLIAPRLVAEGMTGSGHDALVGWLLWPGAALLVAGGVTSLLWELKSVGRALRGWRALAGGGVPMALAGLLTAVAIVGLARWAFGVPVLLGIAALGVALLGALISARAAGEAGLVPLGPLGQLTQLGYAAVAPGNPVADLAAGHVVAGGVVQTAQTLESFKVGQLLDVEPRRQVGAALVGIVVGLVVAPLAYLLLTRLYGIGSVALPAPSALAWKALAQLAATGAAELPRGAGLAAGLGLASGALLASLQRTRLHRFVPSPLVVGLAFLFPFSITATIAVGTFLRFVLSRRLDPDALAAAGAGAVAGESLVALVVASLTAIGLLSA